MTCSSPGSFFQSFFQKYHENDRVDRGNSVVMIEHNPEVIKSADWIIDPGSEGGNKGGKLVFEGTPEEMLVSGPPGKTLRPLIQLLKQAAKSSQR